MRNEDKGNNQNPENPKKIRKDQLNAEDVEGKEV
jgi:hypothetical protein